MKKVIVFSPIFVLLLIACAYAQVSIKSEVDKTNITVDNVLTYKLIITSSEKTIPTPHLPKFTGFNVISSAQTSTVSLAAGNVKTIIVYEFVLAPVTTGKVKIEPSSIEIKKETLSTEALEIEVKPGTKAPRPKPEETPPEETEQPPQITL